MLFSLARMARISPILAADETFAPLASTPFSTVLAEMSVRADGTYRTHEEVLSAVAVRETRYCNVCGQPFECYGGSIRVTCSNRCNNRRWRAIGMLAGTHGNVGGRFVRL